MQRAPALRRTAGRRCRDELDSAVGGALSPQEQLFRACMSGDRRRAVRALERGADLSAPLMAVPLKGRWRGVTQFRPNLLLHAVVAAGDVALTALLLSRGADPRRADPDGRTALHALAAAGRLDATTTGRLARLLVAAGADLEQTDSAGRSACHLAAGAGHAAALAALAQLGADCGRADSAGNSPLHEAVQSGSGLTTLLALRLSPACLQRANSAGRPPLALAAGPDTARPLLAAGAAVDAATLLALLQRAPDAVPAALDSCVTTNDAPLESSTLEVSVTFSAFCGGSPATEDRLLAAVVASQQFHLLKHDAVEPFLHAKWCRVRHLYYVNLALCAALTLMVSGYCWARLGRASDGAQTALAVGVAPLAAIMAVREVFQVVHDPHQYVRSFENWVEVLLLMLIGALLAAHGGTSDRFHWLEHTVAWTLPTAWLELTLMLGRFPTFGVYINMFVSAARRLMLFVLLLTPLVIGFAVGFHVLLGAPSTGQDDVWGPFMTLPVSHITTTMMMVGEYNYDDVFLGSGFGASAGPLLALFIALMSIMAVNLLIGMTVADTRGVFREAKLQSLRHTAVQVLQVETVLRSTLLRALLPSRLLRRQQQRAAVLPLLRAPAAGAQCGFTAARGAVTLDPQPEDDLSPAVFRPNSRPERRTVYLRPSGGGALVASGLQTRGWMQRGLLTLLRRRQQQPADQHLERLLDALLAELSRPSSVTDEELLVLTRAAWAETPSGVSPPERAPWAEPSSAVAAPPAPSPGGVLQTASSKTDRLPPDPQLPHPVDGGTAGEGRGQERPAPDSAHAVDGGAAREGRGQASSTPEPAHAVDGKTKAGKGQAKPVPNPPESDRATASKHPAQDSRISSTQPRPPTDTPRVRKTGDRLGASPDAAAVAGTGTGPPRRPGRAERRRERWRKEALAQRDATVALCQKLNTVLVSVGDLSRKVTTLQRRLAVGDALTQTAARNSSVQRPAPGVR
ncbi:Transient receptor potential channel pyrexia [Amphibalanus amphitrite]|uniref:Transient receptor potential channel pyrexia n=1 Tax=Amphibalanus amphitrite TaxID=1232801 RepID=A0A6A4VEV1_AMPAM|nr:transient receptor potential channel pyrexia-like [Amphibalanus amphitrite]XP_043204882.1 transient receptor potential channel pyrexia-like [Amphibalanus amphitrite]KAF0294947.1 Transient receptor potential channel pyrexia [Amphibalanus amphitrite]